MLVSPPLAAAFVLAGIIAPSRTSRWVLLAAAGIEGAVAMYAVLQWYRRVLLHLSVRRSASRFCSHRAMRYVSRQDAASPPCRAGRACAVESSVFGRTLFLEVRATDRLSEAPA